MKKYYFKDLSRKDETICMNESIFDHGSEVHNHDFIEITYITKGNGLYKVNDTQVNIKAGDLVIVDENDIHQFTPISRDLAWRNVIFLRSALPEDCQIDFSNMIIKGRDEEFSYLFNDMKYEYYNKNIGYERIIENHFLALLTKVSRKTSNNINDNTTITRDELIALVKGYFKDSSSFSNVSLKLLAEQVHVTPKYFSVLFKRKVGITLTEFTRIIRLDVAATMLCESNSDVLSIMHFVGYKDSKYFYKAFKERYQLTPAVYRKKYST